MIEALIITTVIISGLCAVVSIFSLVCRVVVVEMEYRERMNRYKAK